MMELRGFRCLVGVMLLGLCLHEPGVSLAQPVCTLTQITDSPSGSSSQPSLDRGSIAFASTSDLTGSNPEGNSEIFLFNGTTVTQITESATGYSGEASLDGGAIAFTSNADYTGQNPDGSQEIFLFDGSTITQITNSPNDFHGRGSWHPSLDGGSIAFSSTSDLTGTNADRSEEIFLYDGSAIVQITDSTTDDVSREPSLDRGLIAFSSSADFTGENPDRNLEIFLFDGHAIKQITHFADGDSWQPSLDKGSIAFLSAYHAGGGNGLYLFNGSTMRHLPGSVHGGHFPLFPSLYDRSVAFLANDDLLPGGQGGGGGFGIFLFDGTTFTRVTTFVSFRTTMPALDRGMIAFEWWDEIFLASCSVPYDPDPPPGPYLISDQIPDFRFKVRITAGDQVIAGEQETDCIGETLCVSGALPGRSEVFLRLIGPRPNGFLWTNLVRFTPSRIEVWAEQISSGKINYYDLPALPREDTELVGLVDKEAFLPESAAGAGAPSIRDRRLGAKGVEPAEPAWVAPFITSRPEAVTFVSDAFPDFRFTVRILAGGQEQAVKIESDCIAETICVSGALPGRSELFLRIIGPRPNGFLWTNLVRFTTSRVEVEIEQLATGETKSYVLDEVPRQGDHLPGRVDKEAFLP